MIGSSACRRRRYGNVSGLSAATWISIYIPICNVLGEPSTFGLRIGEDNVIGEDEHAKSY